MLTLEFFNQIPDGCIFQTGLTTDNAEGINMFDSGENLQWVAKKGGGDDWAIYIDIASNGIDYIAQNGNKVTHGGNIMKCVPCEEEVFKKYRY